MVRAWLIVDPKTYNVLAKYETLEAAEEGARQLMLQTQKSLYIMQGSEHEKMLRVI